MTTYIVYLLYKEPQFQYGVMYIMAENMDEGSERASEVTKNMINLRTWFIEEYVREN